MDNEPIKKEIYRLIIEPGLWRDYTTFSSPGCTQLQWFRFYHNRLKRMGGWQYIAGLPAYTVEPNFQPNNGPYGDPLAEPSYPSKQYSNQDYSMPWEATYKKIDGTPYDQYNFTFDGNARFADGTGISSDGYRIPRKALTVILDSVDTVVVTTDYDQEATPIPELWGGIAFARLISPVTPTNFVRGYFPSGFEYTANNIYSWSLDSVNNTSGFVTAGSSTYIVAHAANPSGSIADDTNSYVFIIEADNMVDGAQLIPLSATPPVGTSMAETCNTEISVSGGVCAVGPFLFAYGNNGLIMNCDLDNPFYWANPASTAWQDLPGLTNAVNIGNAKVVKGISYPGSTTYSALFWSLDSLTMATFVGSPSVWSFTQIDNNISIISGNSVVRWNSLFFWIGDGRFFAFDGQVREIQNNQNRSWFWDNLNYEVSNKVWGILNPKFSEVIWFVPMFGSVECNWMLIYNHETQCWYDCELARSAGVYSSVFGAPLWFQNIPNAQNEYEMDLNETGLNAIDKFGVNSAIPASFTTPDLGFMSNPQNASPKSSGGWFQNWTELMRVEPDFVGTGGWDLEVQTRYYANSDIISYTPQLFDNTTEKLDMRITGRIMQIMISNDTINSDFYLGDLLLTTNVSDAEGI